MTQLNRSREATWLDYLREGPERGSVANLEGILDLTRNMPQRRRLASLSWWLPGFPTLGQPVRLLVLVVLLMLLVMATGIALVASRPRLPAPYGPAANGALGYEADRVLTVQNVDGSHRHLVAGGEGRNAGLRFSPDGTQFVFWSHNADGMPIWALYVARADGNGVHKISGDLAVETHPGFLPSWSPDSSRVVFASETDLDGNLYNGPSALFIADADGFLPPMRLVHDDGQDHSPAWSPNGEWIAYGRFNGSDNALAVVRPDGTGTRILHQQPVTHGADEPSFAETITWTSDSEQLAYVRGPDASNAAERDPFAYVVVTDLRGNEQTLHVDPAGWAHLPSWSPDDRWLAFDTGEANMRIWIVGRDGSGLRELGGCRESYELIWSPDANYVVSSCAKSVNVIPIANPSARHQAPVPAGAVVTDWQRVAP